MSRDSLVYNWVWRASAPGAVAVVVAYFSTVAWPATVVRANDLSGTYYVGGTSEGDAVGVTTAADGASVLFRINEPRPAFGPGCFGRYELKTVPLANHEFHGSENYAGILEQRASGLFGDAGAIAGAGEFEPRSPSAPCPAKHVVSWVAFKSDDRFAKGGGPTAGATYVGSVYGLAEARGPATRVGSVTVTVSANGLSLSRAELDATVGGCRSTLLAADVEVVDRKFFIGQYESRTDRARILSLSGVMRGKDELVGGFTDMGGSGCPAFAGQWAASLGGAPGPTPVPTTSAGGPPVLGQGALLVSSITGLGGDLTRSLVSTGCVAETVAVLRSGAWVVYVEGAPAVVNASFGSVTVGMPFFARCR